MQTHRLDARWLRLDPAKDRMAYTATWELRRLSGWLDRICPSRPRPWGAWRKGSQWWTLPLDALTLLGAELPRLRRSGRLSGTVCADEHVIQTLIAAHFPERLAPARRPFPGEARSGPPLHRLGGGPFEPAHAHPRQHRSTRRQRRMVRAQVRCARGPVLPGARGVRSHPCRSARIRLTAAEKVPAACGARALALPRHLPILHASTT